MSENPKENTGAAEAELEANTKTQSEIYRENDAKYRESSRRYHETLAQFEGIFEKLNAALAKNLGAALGYVAHDPITDEQKSAVFRGKPPSAEVLAQRLAAGDFKNIVVLCGAGMSTSAGIPDFRSPETGVYAQLKREQEERKARAAKQLKETDGDQSAENSSKIAAIAEGVDLESLPTPESLFTIDFYRSNQRPFIIRAGHLWPGEDCEYRPTPSHCLLKLLEPNIRRIYTQNIDELETCMNLLPREKIKRCHGSFEAVHCINCQRKFSRGTPEYENVRHTMVVEGKTALCPDPECPEGQNAMKPSIVFFGEQMSNEFREDQEEDFKVCDLVICMGTSLKVAPFSGLPQKAPLTVPRLLLNGEPVGEWKNYVPHTEEQIEEAKEYNIELEHFDNYRDASLIGDLDKSSALLAAWMGRTKEFKAICERAQCKNYDPKSQLGVKDVVASTLPPLSFSTAKPSANTKAAPSTAKPKGKTSSPARTKSPAKKLCTQAQRSTPPPNSITGGTKGAHVPPPAKASSVKPSGKR